MKTLFFSIIASLLLCFPVDAQTKSGNAGVQKIHLKFGRVSKNCGGFGICEFWIDVTIGEVVELFTALNTKGRLNLNISGQYVERNKATFPNNLLIIDEDFTLPPATARTLGFPSYTIRKGKYPVTLDPKTNSYNCTF